VDADVLVHPEALRLLLSAFDDPAIAAAFGSYDDAPVAQGVVSQYRNLLHHHVHQRNAGEVESFWAGLGAVRRSVFDVSGGFDEITYRRPEMEDVELGYRIRDAGHRIVLDPGVQGTHLKIWTLGGMLTSDFIRRGVPWARLLVRRGMLLHPKGLSLGAGERISAVLPVSP
jgi:GT2 family glycosyltransferase